MWYDFARPTLFKAHFPTIDELLEGFDRAAQPLARREHTSLRLETTTDGASLTVELPGFERDSIDVEVQRNRVTIAAERKPLELAEGERLYQQERASGRFERSFKLGFEVDAEAVKATYNHGLLQVELPRAASEKPRRIAITTD